MLNQRKLPGFCATGAALSAITSLCLACGDTSVNTQVAEVWDSAGVEMVTYPVIAQAPQHVALADTPDVLLGGLHEDLRLEFQGNSYWSTVVPMSDGRLVASDGAHLKFFGPDGSLEQIIGAAGDGPGEYRDIQSICRFAGDSLVIVDVRQRRISILSSEGELARTLSVLGHVPPNACFSDGSVLVQSERLPEVSGEQPQARFQILSSEGDTVGELPPFPRSSYTGVEREVWYAVHDDQVYVGGAVEMDVKVYNRDGELIRIVRTQDEPEPMSPDEAVEARGEPTSGSQPSEDAAITGATKPSYSRMLVDGDGRIWLLVERVGSADGTWVVLAQDGSWFGQIPMAPADRSVRRIVDVRSGRAVVSARDSMGALVLAIHQVVERD